MSQGCDTAYLQGKPLSRRGFTGLADQRLPIKKSRGQHTLHGRSAFPVRSIHCSTCCEKKPHQVWPRLISCHVYWPDVLIIPSEVLACSITPDHMLLSDSSVLCVAGSGPHAESGQGSS